MSQRGKYQVAIVFKAATAALEAEGDRLFASHAKWMEGSHHRSGELALLSYNVSKNDEFSNPLDPTSAPTGAKYFLLVEVYETAAGVADHWKQGQESWADFGAMIAWLQACDSQVIHGSEIFLSLW